MGRLNRIIVSIGAAWVLLWQGGCQGPVLHGIITDLANEDPTYDWYEEDKVSAGADAEANGEFARSVCIAGDYAIVGAPGEDAARGAAYVYLRSGSDWTLQQRLTASDAQDGDRFGHSVSISGGYALVGAYGDDDQGGLAGSAYVFKRDLTTWTQIKKLLDDQVSQDRFGYAVAIAGDYAAVTARDDDEAVVDQGVVYFYYRLQGGADNWGKLQRVWAGDARTGDKLGSSVDLFGDYAIVGAPNHDLDAGDLNTNEGAAYVLTRSGSVWSVTKKLMPADLPAGGLFGSAVAITDLYAAAGAPAPSLASIFTNDGGLWTEARITAPGGLAVDAFGSSLDLDGSYAVIGAPQYGAADAGAVYLFEREAGQWAFKKRLAPLDAADGDQFGWSAAVTGNWFLAGSYYAEVAETRVQRHEPGDYGGFGPADETWVLKVKHDNPPLGGTVDASIACMPVDTFGNLQPESTGLVDLNNPPAPQITSVPAAATSAPVAIGVLPTGTLAFSGAAVDTENLAGVPTVYAWSFGGSAEGAGQSSALLDPAAYNVTDTLGQYTVSLTITEGVKDLATDLVQKGRASRLVVVKNRPSAAAAASPLSGTAPLAVSYDSAGSDDHDPLTDERVLAWTFSGGLTSDQAAPTRTCHDCGTYAASLVVMDRYGLSSAPDSAGDVVVVLPENDWAYFPQHAPLPFDPQEPPVIDGEVAGEPRRWWDAYKLTFANGTNQGEAEVQCLKAYVAGSEYLYLSFEIYSDPLPSPNDVVLLAFRANGAQCNRNGDRRLAIYPFPITAGHDPARTELWKVDAGTGDWVAVTAVPPLPGLEAKVRSSSAGSATRWCLELKIPAVAATGSEWVSLSNEFLFYCNVVNVVREAGDPVPADPGDAVEMSFPRNEDIYGNLSSYPFYPYDWGRAGKGPGAAALVKGIWVNRDDIQTDNTPEHRILRPANPGDPAVVNTFRATVRNDQAQAAAGVTTLFKIADWGITADTSDDWVPIVATGNPAGPLPVPAFDVGTGDPGDAEFSFSWSVDYATGQQYLGPISINGYPMDRKHQCVLVELDAEGDTNIKKRSEFRNMEFVSASRFSRVAVISARGLGDPAGGGAYHRFLLHEATIERLKPGQEERQLAERQTESNFRWYLHGYRDKGGTIIVNGKEYRVHEPFGAFGYSAAHEGPVFDWRARLRTEGRGRGEVWRFQALGGGLYRLEVAPGNRALVKTVLCPAEVPPWAVSAHVGSAFPDGAYANSYKTGLSAFTDAGFHLNRFLAFMLLGGFHAFPAKGGSQPAASWFSLAAGVRCAYDVPGPLLFYGQLCPGLYFPLDGAGEYGLDVGAGASYWLKPYLTFDLGMDQHWVWPSAARFLQVHTGITFRH